MTGATSGTLDLGAPVRSTIVNLDDVAYVVTTDGVLHKVTVGSTGQPRELARVTFADYSTSSPAIADGVIYVGGSKNGQGMLTAIDAQSMRLLGSVDTANGTPLPGEVKSMPTLVRDSGGIVALFTCNGVIGEYPDYTGGGGVYAYRLGDTQATLAFDPPAGMHNYSMGSIAYGLGRFYYVNDSGSSLHLRSRLPNLEKGGMHQGKGRNQTAYRTMKRCCIPQVRHPPSRFPRRQTPPFPSKRSTKTKLPLPPPGQPCKTLSNTRG